MLQVPGRYEVTEQAGDMLGVTVDLVASASHQISLQDAATAARRH
jgi:hypothetical protein